MANLKVAIRWKPSNLRSTLETVIVPGNPDATPPTSPARVAVLQAVIYDADKVATTGNPYVAGAPASEQFITTILETPIQLAVSAFAGLTDAQAQALWDQALATQQAAWTADPQINEYIAAAKGKYLSPLVLIG